MNSLKNRLDKLENLIDVNKHNTINFDQYCGETLYDALLRFNKRTGKNFTEKEVKTKWRSFNAGELGTIWHHPNFRHDMWVLEQNVSL